MDPSSPSLGTLIADLRRRKGWTLEQMSRHSGIPISTLSKVEHNRLTLTYERLLQMSHRLDIPISEILDRATDNSVTSKRRSVGRTENAIRFISAHGEHLAFCDELRQKRFTPMVTKVSATTFEQTGGLIRHSGEQYIHVISGKIMLHTEFYTPLLLDRGAGIYFDSNMGHAYTVADGSEATILGVYSGAEMDDFRSMKPS